MKRFLNELVTVGVIVCVALALASAASNGWFDRLATGEASVLISTVPAPDPTAPISARNEPKHDTAVTPVPSRVPATLTPWPATLTPPAGVQPYGWNRDHVIVAGIMYVASDGDLFAMLHACDLLQDTDPNAQMAQPPFCPEDAGQIMAMLYKQ